MSDRPKILAVDAARRFGWAYGELGRRPESGSDVWGGKDSTYAERMGACFKWIANFHSTHPIDCLFIERALPDTGMTVKDPKTGVDKRVSNFETSEQKNGYIGVLVAFSNIVGIRNPMIDEGERRIWLSTIRSKLQVKKGTDASASIRETMLAIGWISEEEAAADKGYDQTDALAIYYTGGLMVAPALMPPIDPLFLISEKRKRREEKVRAEEDRIFAEMRKPF